MSDKQPAVSLRTVAERVGLAVCSVSAILNNTPASMAIPRRTKDRVFRAAGELNYRPNLWARSLRTKRTRLVAAITSDIVRPKPHDSTTDVSIVRESNHNIPFRSRPVRVRTVNANCIAKKCAALTLAVGFSEKSMRR